jgi:hypothetical protein
MPRKRRIRAADALEVITYVDQDTPLEEYPSAYFQRDVGSFEWMIRRADRYWREQAVLHPSRPGRQENPFSVGAYARTITWQIDIVRHLLQSKQPDPQQLAIAALRLGDTLRKAQRRFKDGPSIVVGARRRRRSHQAGQRSGQVRHQKQTDRDLTIAERARKIRQTEPYDRWHSSTTKLAQQLAHHAKAAPATIEKALRRLGIK